MAKKAIHQEEKKTQVRNQKSEEQKKQNSTQHEPQPPLLALQNQIGNAAAQRMLAQRSGNGPTELDDDTAERINSARGGGQALDSTMQTGMSEAMGADFSQVRVHTGGESDQLNQQLGAKAFTTGRDVFFRDGEYNPHSSGGQELIAHELTHVVQQGSGAVASGGKMAVNAPGDRFESEADSTAKAVTSSDVASPVQRQEEEEEIQTKRDVQRQEEEEGEVQMQAEEEEELAQAQEMEEEEEMA